MSTLSFKFLPLFSFAAKSKSLKRQTKIAADDILFFYFYLSKKIRFDFQGLKHQVLFSLINNEKIFMNVVCCSRDCRFKG